jgi:hypothetical protein
MQATKIHRDTLSQEVWEEPITKLSIRYNISDVAPAKVCRNRKLRVPIPPRGYWARIQNGQHIMPPKLPKLPSDIRAEAMISSEQIEIRESPINRRSRETNSSV